MSVETCIRRRLTEMKSSTFRQRLVRLMIKQVLYSYKFGEYSAQPVARSRRASSLRGGGLSSVCLLVAISVVSYATIAL